MVMNPCWRMAAILAFAVIGAAGVANDSKGGTTENKLIGTWKLISAKYDGNEVKRPEGYTQLKHVTPAQFMWALYDSDGDVKAALGGSYTLKGEDYVETPEYGVGQGLEQLRGKAQTFTWKIDGKRWLHNGKLSSGLPIEEVWERVEKK